MRLSENCEFCGSDGFTASTRSITSTMAEDTYRCRECGALTIGLRSVDGMQAAPELEIEG